MDIATNKLAEIEAKLNELLTQITDSKNENEGVLLLFNPTAEQYSEAWENYAILNLVESYISMLLNTIKHGDLKKAGLFIDFTLYELERFGEKDETNFIIFIAQQSIKEIYTTVSEIYFNA